MTTGEIIFEAVKNAEQIVPNRDDSGFCINLGEKRMEIRMRNTYLKNVNILFGKDESAMYVIYQGIYPSDYDMFQLIMYCEERVTMDTKSHTEQAINWLKTFGNRVKGA